MTAESFKLGETIHRRHKSGLYFHEDTAPEVADCIARLRGTSQRIRLFLGDTETGRDWQSEYDVTGRVSASWGPCVSPLLISNARSMGGGAILTQCVLAIISAPGRFLYRHPKFAPGVWTVAPIEFATDRKTYRAATFCNGELYSRHETEAQALRLAAFMRGDRMAK